MIDHHFDGDDDQLIDDLKWYITSIDNSTKYIDLRNPGAVFATDTLLVSWRAVHNNLKIRVWSFQESSFTSIALSYKPVHLA